MNILGILAIILPVAVLGFHGSGTFFAIAVAASMVIIALGEIQAELKSVNGHGYWRVENVVDHAYSALFCILLLGAMAYCGFSYLNHTSESYRSALSAKPPTPTM